MNMKELNSKFLSLLRYVPYTVDEKPKVQWFLSYLHFHIKDIIEYDNPKTLEEAMRMANFCYEQNRKRESMPNWKAKRSNNFEHKKKGFISNGTILEIITHVTFLIRISKEIKVTHSQTLMALEIKKLLIITSNMLRIMNVKNW